MGPPVVAVLNTNDDMVDMLRIAFERAGLLVVSAHVDDIRRGRSTLLDFIRERQPHVVVYDVAPPSEQSWRSLEHLRSAPDMSGRRFVITSVNAKMAKELVGTSESVFDIVGKPYDVDELTEVVRQAARARPTRA
jgi:DNA-binding NtrC family response regulator